MANASFFDAAWHEPGAEDRARQALLKRVRRRLTELLRDLARHPSTARFVSPPKLARHLRRPTSRPPRWSIVWRRSFLDSAGHLPTVSLCPIGALARSTGDAQATKLETPEELVISSARALRVGDAMLARGRDAGAGLQRGQRVRGTRRSAGWTATLKEWLGPDAVWKRLEWATRVGDRLGGKSMHAPRRSRSLRLRWLSDTSRVQIDERRRRFADCLACC